MSNLKLTDEAKSVLIKATTPTDEEVCHRPKHKMVEFVESNDELSEGILFLPRFSISIGY